MPSFSELRKELFEEFLCFVVDKIFDMLEQLPLSEVLDQRITDRGLCKFESSRLLFPSFPRSSYSFA